jgi:hypothetical protein
MMSFELKADESLPDGMRRIVKKELEQIREYMEGRTKDSRDDIVHESRKCLKKVRAVLRLVRPAIGRKGSALCRSAGVAANIRRGRVCAGRMRWPGKRSGAPARRRSAESEAPERNEGRGRPPSGLQGERRRAVDRGANGPPGAHQGDGALCRATPVARVDCRSLPS